MIRASNPSPDASATISAARTAVSSNSSARRSVSTKSTDNPSKPPRCTADATSASISAPAPAPGSTTLNAPPAGSTSDAIVRAACDGVTNWPRPDRSSLPLRDSSSEFNPSANRSSSPTPPFTSAKANRLTSFLDQPPSIEPPYDTARDHPRHKRTTASPTSPTPSPSTRATRT